MVRAVTEDGYTRAPRRRQAVKAALIAERGAWCEYCDRGFPASQLTLDHVIPRKRIADLDLDRTLLWDPANLKLACDRCNKRKGARTARPRPGRVEVARGW
jgi:5-methylcytosine-specific restriction endonuclease McrA